MCICGLNIIFTCLPHYHDYCTIFYDLYIELVSMTKYTTNASCNAPPMQHTTTMQHATTRKSQRSGVKVYPACLILDDFAEELVNVCTNVRQVHAVAEKAA